MQLSDSLQLKVGARGSPLARAQTAEVLEELQIHHPSMQFDPVWVDTVGDKDLVTSLRGLEKTDFFTREVDDLQLCGEVRVAIHSAKDLPGPLPEGLQIIALTVGVDSSDSLVLRDGDTFQQLQPGSRIATSSARREEAVRQLRTDLAVVDIRGNIGQRLQKLLDGEVDGLVVAEAALIRLGLCHLNRVFLPGAVAPLQGQLAVVGREDDHEMAQLFACIDCREQ